MAVKLALSKRRDGTVGRLSRFAARGKLSGMHPPRRIVSLISSATEMVCLFGRGEALVGISHECDYPAEIAAKPRLTRSLVDAAASSAAIDGQVRSLAESHSALYEIDVDALARLEPELVLTQAQCDVCAVRYEDVVDAVAALPFGVRPRMMALNPQSLEDVFADIARVGEAIGSGEAAARVLADLRRRVERVRSRSAELAANGPRRVACLEWIEPPMLAGNWMPELVAWAGGSCELTTAGRHSTVADWQAIVDFDPEVIVIMPCGFDLPRAIVEAQTLPALHGWERLAAVRQGRVFAVDGNAYFNRSGPRLVDSLEILARLVHPEAYDTADNGRPIWRRLATAAGALVPVDSRRWASGGDRPPGESRFSAV